MRCKFALLLSLSATTAFAQLDGLQGDYNKPDQPPLRKLPTGVLLVKGAEPSASDSTTPLPENGRLANDAYSNDYFGLSFKLPPQLVEKYKGPPPSDSGRYVLTELVPSERFSGSDKATILVSAQDQFFALVPQPSAIDFVKASKESLAPYYETERAPAEVTIAGRPFARFDYTSRVAGIHWVILATDVRCHSVEFVLTGRNPKALDALVAGLNEMKVASGEAPACIANYADANTLYKKDPVLADRKFNPIPVRIVIDKKGRVKHVHVLSAFPEQARLITDALFQWRFKPYLVKGEPAEVETGMLFGVPSRAPNAMTAAVKTSD